MSSSMKFGFVLLLASAAALFALRGPLLEHIAGDAGPPAGAAGPPGGFVVPVKAMRARLETFEDRVEALGTLRANESVMLTTPIMETVSAIRFDDGQRVEKGDILVEMTTAEEKALYSEAESSLSEAKSQYERVRDLAERKIASESLLDQRRREYETAQARLMALEARLADRIVRAPFSGVMGLRTVSVGALSDPVRPIARIEDDSVMKLDFSVPSTFLTSLKPGLTIVARATGYDGKEFRGSVASIDNAVDEVTRTIRVRAMIPNPDRQLKPGVLMTVDLLKNARKVVVVPEETIMPTGGRSFIFVVNAANDIVERREVKVGARRPGEAEILEGLEVGELVVTDGGLKLSAGTRVKVDEVAAPVSADRTATGGRS